MQSLIDRFEELTMSPPTPPTAEGDAALGEEETGVMDDAVSAHHKALVGATRSISGQEAQLNKLRTHFQKVIAGPLWWQHILIGAEHGSLWENYSLGIASERPVLQTIITGAS